MTVIHSTSILPSWNDTPARAAIADFVERATSGPDAIPVAERIAVLRRQRRHALGGEAHAGGTGVHPRAAGRDGGRRSHAPREATLERRPSRTDTAWLAGVVEKHYAGDETEVKVLLGGVVAAFAGIDAAAYAAAAARFVRDRRHPVRKRTFAACAYAPMIELLRFLEANEFTTLYRVGRQPGLHPRLRGRRVRPAT